MSIQTGADRLQPGLGRHGKREGEYPQPGALSGDTALLQAKFDGQKHPEIGDEQGAVAPEPERKLLEPELPRV